MNFKAFFLDLDGTILRGQTVCQVIAEEIGKSKRMNELERKHSFENLIIYREEIISWYKDYSIEKLINSLKKAKFSPGIFDFCNYCNQKKIPFAIVSLTWSFAVRYFADMLGTSHYLGSDVFIKNQEINHVFPENKATYIINFALNHNIDISRCCAIGDSWGDYPMLEASGFGLLVGKKKRKDLPKGCYEIDARKNILSEVVKYQNNV